ncbi:MAG TPA: FtsX-like permease family protein [Candidatus Angelobacter sp.]|nr:FtsX-like permease family protein [Candidatus Angelobacter sp.]
MKYRGLLFANLFRKKTRLVLTLGSFAVALFLFSLLALVKQAFSAGVDVAGVDRLVVINRTSIIQPLPVSYRDRILRIPGVKRVTYDNWFGGYYQDPKNVFSQFAIDVENQREVFHELVVPDDQWQTFLKDRQGAIVGANTAKRFGWKIGQRIPIKGTIFPGTWEFNIDGIYAGDRPGEDTTQFWFHWDYLYERAKDIVNGTVGWYTVLIENPNDAVRIVKAIDDQFANSPFETHTDTEKAFATGFAKQLGNIGFLVIAIGTIVFFTLLLVTGNTMAISVRERTGELAVLKAVGYSDRFVMLLVLAEAMLIAAVGGGLGLLTAAGFAMLLAATPMHNFIPFANLSASVAFMGLGLTLLFGAASGFLPAVGGMRLRVIDALRRV